jgi:CMP/dCMP kinase
MPTPRTIAIDGPAGAGKSTIGALVAERLGYLFLDTGAMYRAVALAALRRGVDPDDGPTLGRLAHDVRIAIGPPTVRDGRAYTVLLDGDDVTWPIRSAEVDRVVSQVARIPDVRDAMVAQQRTIAKKGRVVMVGRDIGTVVLADADRKIFLTASASERAKRRGEELAARGEVRPRPELLHGILRRDQLDSERVVSPLHPAEDAVVVETDGLAVGQALDAVLKVITRAPAPPLSDDVDRAARHAERAALAVADRLPSGPRSRAAPRPHPARGPGPFACARSLSDRC